MRKIALSYGFILYFFDFYWNVSSCLFICCIFFWGLSIYILSYQSCRLLLVVHMNPICCNKNNNLLYKLNLFSVSVQFSHPVMSDSLWPRGPQHTRLACPSPTPGVYSNSCPLSRWCHPTISSSVVPFSSCLRSFPASGSFLMSQFFTSGGRRIEVSSSASVLPMNIQDWFPLGLTGVILQSKGLSRVFSNTTVQKHQFFSFLSSPTLISIHSFQLLLIGSQVRQGLILSNLFESRHVYLLFTYLCIKWF